MQRHGNVIATVFPALVSGCRQPLRPRAGCRWREPISSYSFEAGWVERAQGDGTGVLYDATFWALSYSPCAGGCGSGHPEGGSRRIGMMLGHGLIATNEEDGEWTRGL